MAIQSSGAISLNDLHIEAGGSSGTLCTLNDEDIRGLISKASGAASSFNQFYGAAATYFNLQFLLILKKLDLSSFMQQTQGWDGSSAIDANYMHQESILWSDNTCNRQD